MWSTSSTIGCRVTKPCEVVEIYTDGACKGNPGPGGWGVLLVCGARRRELKGGELSTTNNRMELMAVIEALGTLTRPSRVRLHTDSQYVHKGMTEWLAGWRARAWRTAQGTAVKNRDLWERLDALARTHRIEWVWVKGHAGHEGNEAADRLANEGVAAVLAMGDAA